MVRKLRKDFSGLEVVQPLFLLRQTFWMKRIFWLGAVIIVHNIIPFRQVVKRRFLPLCKIFYYNQTRVKKSRKNQSWMKHMIWCPTCHSSFPGCLLKDCCCCSCGLLLFFASTPWDYTPISKHLALNFFLQHHHLVSGSAGKPFLRVGATFRLLT